jgi:non-ribosomal peptide synthetase component E (peptide arylation enzyme)
MPGHDQREIAICSRLHPVAQIPSSKCKSSQQGRGALADFKVPREIRFVDEMPRSTLEKVAKAELWKMLG